jgi:DNA-binding NarL/FixJ family response regulator
VIAERTAMRHVEHIFSKLGVHSRAEVGEWVAHRGLDRLDGSM